MKTLVVVPEGSSDGPLHTLAAARQAVRELIAVQGLPTPAF